MTPLLARLLLGAAAAGAVALAAALLRVGRMLAGCLRAKRAFLSSPIPGPPLSNPVIGHVPALIGPKAIWNLSRWTGQLGPVFKLQLLDRLALMVTDPDTIARITRRTGPGPYTPKPHFFYEPLELGYSPRRPNLVSADDGPYWRAVRQAAAPCFSATNMKQVVPLVVRLSQRVADRMSGQALVDVTDGAKRITSDVMGDLLFGEDLGGTRWERSEYMDVFFHALKGQAATVSNPYHLWMLWDPEVRQQRRCLAAHNRIMSGKVARLRAQPPAQHTIAAHIMSAIDPATGSPLDDSQVKAEIATFMAAGFETTSHAITWCLALLASHPDVQAQVFGELSASGLTGRAFEASDLGRLPLLSAVIKEALRLCPPAPWGTVREVVTGGAVIGGHEVPKGTLVMVPLLPFALAKHTYGPDAVEFRPQRWLAGNGSGGGGADSTVEDAGSTSSSPTAAAPAARAAPPDPLTFMTGPRDCIGQNLAKLELQVVLATLLSRFAFTPGPELAAELEVAGATGQPPLAAVHALAGVHGSLQPLSGHLHLRVAARA